MARIIIRARVLNLESVPQWIVISDGDNFQGESWTVHCEVISQVMLGQIAQDEDPIPEQEDIGDHMPFDFFGFGQQANGDLMAPFFHEDGNEGDGADAAEWGVWPDEEHPTIKFRMHHNSNISIKRM